MDSCWHLFETEFNWMAGQWSDGELHRLVFGATDPQKVAVQLGVESEWVQVETTSMKDARVLLTRYARGESVDLTSIPINLCKRTVFQRKVLEECRKVPWGETVSYGELAERCGVFRAARAVGTVMRTNRHPLIIPCHRVVAANGRLGGYSAHDGVATKRSLLAREGVVLADR